MEIKVNDLTLGFQPTIPFRVVSDGYGHHVPTFRIMQTPQLDSLVIVYRWVDPIQKYFNDREEAFYIDGINPQNYDEAKKIILSVYAEIIKAFQEDNNQDFDLQSYILNIYGQSRKLK